MDGKRDVPEETSAVKDGSIYKCQTCQGASFTSKADFDEHLQTAEHKKNAKSKTSIVITCISKQTVDSQTVLRQEVKTDNLKESPKDDNSQNPVSGSECSSGPPELSPSTDHQQCENVAENSNIQRELEDLPENVSAVKLEDNLLSCQICNMKFSGPFPYKQHMNSNIHKKYLRKKELEKKLEELQKEIEEIVVIDEAGGRFCKVCNVAFSGVEGAYQHLVGRKHCKVKQRQEMLQEIHKELESIQAEIKEERENSPEP